MVRTKFIEALGLLLQITVFVAMLNFMGVPLAVAFMIRFSMRSRLKTFTNGLSSGRIEIDGISS